MNRVILYGNQLSTNNRKQILVIGSGLMAEVLIDYLLKRNEVNCLLKHLSHHFSKYKNHIIVASALIAEAKSLVSKKVRCTAEHLDINDKEMLRKFVKLADVVVGYVPPQFIVQIAKMCLEESVILEIFNPIIKRHLVTAQYIQPELKAMNEEAKKKSVLFLNEMGLDPGIDHLATVRVIDEVHKKGGKYSNRLIKYTIRILEYESWCGGLPAPEFTDNPFGYKFSWSPLAAIKNINNDGVYLENNKEKYIPASHLLYSRQNIEVNPALTLEGYPNRNSIPYKELYGLKDCTKLIRGTLRYQGFSVIMSAFKSLGIATDEQIPQTMKGASFFHLLNQLLKNEPNVSKNVAQEIVNQYADIAHTDTHTKKEIGDLLGKIFNRIFAHDYYKSSRQNEIIDDSHRIFQAMDWLRLFDENLKINVNCSQIENFATLLQGRLQYKNGETDFVVMQHIFKIQYPNDQRIYTKKSTLILTGDKNGKTAMAQTVSIPTGIAVQLILDNKIKQRGVHMPNLKEINDPIIEELQKYGLMCVESEE